MATGLKIGAKGLIAGGLGSLLYNGVQSATGGDSYRRNTSPGESLALGLGNFGGGQVGEIAATRAGKALGGKVASSVAGEAAGAAGEAAAGAVGGEEVGGTLGTIVGGPVGTIAGAAIGGALGEFLTHATLKHLAGYNPNAVKRVLANKVTPPAPGQEEAAQVGEVGGGIIGNIGGATGEGLGGAVGSSLGIISAKVHAESQRILPGRPNSSQGTPA